MICGEANVSVHMLAMHTDCCFLVMQKSAVGVRSIHSVGVYLHSLKHTVSVLLMHYSFTKPDQIITHIVQT